jgi:hypothetical protein
VQIPAAQAAPAQIAPLQDAPVNLAPGPSAPERNIAAQVVPDSTPDTSAESIPAVVDILPLPVAVLTQREPDGVVQVPRATHTDRSPSKLPPTARKAEDDAATDPPAATAVQSLPVALPPPVDALPLVQPDPGNDTDTGDTKGTVSVTAQAVGHVSGPKPSGPNAKSPDAQPAATLATPHPAEGLPVSPQSVSEKSDAGQSTTTPATVPTVTPPALHPPTVAAAPAVVPANPAPASAPSVHAVSPADQVAPALVAMGHAPDGAQRLTMRLTPPELGQVQIRIDRSPDAAARVDITVEKTETLTLLLRDQPQLQRALDQAGVPPEGRSVTFHVMAPEPASRAEVLSVPASSGATSNGLAGEYSQSASRQGGHPAQQQTAADGSDEAVQADIAPPPWMRWSRAGLDITA